MKNFLKRLGIIILVIVILLVAVPRIVNLIKHGKEDDGPEGYYVSKEMLEERYDAVDSDIESWTMGDKFRAGLQPVEGADSDGDGLTDKDEIEVYGSDPLKTSTADDLYTDGYKVDNGLDLNTYYERDDVSFDNNYCTEIELSATTVRDTFAHVEEERIPKIDGYTVFKAYDVYSYGNEIKIDVTDICNENDVSVKDLSVLIGHWYGGTMWTSKISADGSIITVSGDLDNSQRYTMLVAKKDGVLSSSKPKFNAVTASSEDFRVDANFLYVLTFGFRNLFVDTKPHLYYVPTGDEKKDQETIGYLLALSYYVVDGIHLGILTDEDVKPVSEIQMKMMKSFLSAYSDFELTEENPYTGYQHLLLAFNQTVILDPEKYKATVVEHIEWTSTSMTGFRVSRDAFPFANFSTEYARGGNCAGISYHTAQIFNNKTAKTSGEFSSDLYENGATSLTWNIAGDEDNDTLTDFELVDYKTRYFNYEREGKDGIISPKSNGEAEFLKMISAYWAEENSYALQQDTYYITEDIGNYNWSMIEDIEHYLDQGKILILCMRNSNSCGHVVNIVGYRTEDEGDSVYFDLYDCNFPFNTHDGRKINNVLEVKRKAYPEGCTDSFSYYYKPYDRCSYEYNSEYNKDGIKVFCVNDTEFNFFH